MISCQLPPLVAICTCSVGRTPSETPWCGRPLSSQFTPLVGQAWRTLRLQQLGFA
ncbi:unnamed protein product [Polarella glacialis]|uniref:Uncharacterized protein n=1 Tax=Polarella glacialis TaxID=89957 RepID=A0A813FCU9_POLGL|nr:unnamed protein product [Polarella glacialis]